MPPTDHPAPLRPLIPPDAGSELPASTWNVFEPETPLVRGLVNQVSATACSWYQNTKDAAGWDGIREIEDRLKILKDPIMCHWQAYGDGLITKADDAIQNKILNPAKCVQSKVLEAKHMLSGYHELSSDEKTTLEALRNRIATQISWCQRAIQASLSPHALKQMMMNRIHDSHMAATRLVDMYTEGGPIGHNLLLQIPRCTHETLKRLVWQSTYKAQEKLDALVEVIGGIFDYLTEQIQRFRSRYPNSEGATRPMPVMAMQTIPVSVPPRPNLSSLQISSPRFNPNANEFVPGMVLGGLKDCDSSDTGSMLTESSGMSDFHRHPSVAGMGMAGLSDDVVVLCERVIQTLKTMLDERNGAPLKQPGLSRKLYSHDQEFKEAVRCAGGLRAFVKRFPEHFRLFPGKGSVWFVALPESEGQEDQEKDQVKEQEEEQKVDK